MKHLGFGLGTRNSKDEHQLCNDHLPYKDSASSNVDIFDRILKQITQHDVADVYMFLRRIIIFYKWKP